MGYRGPWILHDMFTRVLLSHSGQTSNINNELSIANNLRILDLGCGSGLCGRVFSHLTNESANCSISIDDTIRELSILKGTNSLSPNLEKIVPIEEFASKIPKTGGFLGGIDISSNMVAISSADVNGYSSLACGHLAQGLQFISSEDNIDRFDLVLAADTFIYVGALGNIFKLVSGVVKRYGYLVFSTELIADPSESELSSLNIQIDDEGELICTNTSGNIKLFSLLESARFGHSEMYITELSRVHGFEVVSSHRDTLRTESSIPLPGMFYVLRKKI